MGGIQVVQNKELTRLGNRRVNDHAAAQTCQRIAMIIILSNSFRIVQHAS
jgi:hypothetical protein